MNVIPRKLLEALKIAGEENIVTIIISWDNHHYKCEWVDVFRL